MPHLFAKCADQAIHIKILMISDGIPILLITSNPSNFQSFLILNLADMQYKKSKNNNAANIFAYATSIINFLVVAQFFKTIYKSIFKHLFAAGSRDGGLVMPIPMYFVL